MKHSVCLTATRSLLFDVGAQFEHVLLARHLELVREAKVLHLDLRGGGTDGWDTTVVTVGRARVWIRQTYQLEVCDSNGAFLVHFLLVLIGNEALHQVPCVYLIISHLLRIKHRQIGGQMKKKEKTSYFVCLLYSFKWWKNYFQLTWQ